LIAQDPHTGNFSPLLNIQQQHDEAAALLNKTSSSQHENTPTCPRSTRPHRAYSAHQVHVHTCCACRTCTCRTCRIHMRDLSHMNHDPTHDHTLALCSRLTQYTYASYGLRALRRVLKFPARAIGRRAAHVGTALPAVPAEVFADPRRHLRSAFGEAFDLIHARPRRLRRGAVSTDYDGLVTA
jgi:hypothetical protein